MASTLKKWSDLGFRLQGQATSVLKDITAYTNALSLAAALKTFEVTGMTDTNPQFLPGLSRPTVDLNGYWNTTVEGILGPCLDGTSYIKKTEFKSYTGRYYNGSVWPTNIKLSGKPEDAQLWSCTLQFSGAFNRTSVTLP